MMQCYELLGMYHAGIIEMSRCCTDLLELDISGCWQVSNKSLYALQESLVHMRGDNPASFSLTIGGQFVLAFSSNYSMVYSYYRN